MLNSINPPPNKNSPQIFFSALITIFHLVFFAAYFYLPNNDEDFLRLVDYENAMLIHLSIMQKIRG